MALQALEVRSLPPALLVVVQLAPQVPLQGAQVLVSVDLLPRHGLLQVPLLGCL